MPDRAGTRHLRRVLALDWGQKRVGVAISDPTGTLARPLQTLVRGSREDDFAAVEELVVRYDVGLVVVGQPISLDGTEGPEALRAARCAEALAARLPVPVSSWDERYSTVAADEILRRNRKKKRGRGARARDGVDAVAAAVILQSYLDSQVGGGS